MTTPDDEPTAEQMAAPTVSTAPTSGTTTAPAARWWHWDALPHHLGRARTSTVILSVLFLAVFALYLNVRPDDGTTRTTPAGGGSDVEAPVNPLVPSEPTTPEPTEEPAPTTSPSVTTTPEEETEAPTTSRTPSSATPSTTAPGTSPGTSGPTGTTGGTTEQETPGTTAPTTP